ncbi:MAG: PstS family phosphate ABC transporter substrate-binding protein [Syntrophothermus sp.]
MMKAMKMMRNSIFGIFLALSVFFISCNQNQHNPPETSEDTPTSGQITISVDETIKPLIEAEKDAFEAIYKRARVIINYKPEAEVMADLLNDSSIIVIVSRKFNESERKSFEQEQLIPRETKIAFDAIAVLANKNNPDTLISLQELKDILLGKITKWNQLSPKGSSADIKLVFDNKNSSIVRYFLELINMKEFPNKSTYGLNSGEEVINYIAKDKNAFGFLGINYVSDTDDVQANGFLETIRIAEIEPADTSKYAGAYYKPYQSNIALRSYPLYRDIYVLSREARAGLGTGFTAFIAGDKGQRIVLKSGLVPATMPIRLIEVDNEALRIEKEKK